jgi:acyl-CoA synthetase (AMP-forming)/AMP-acid ligase II
VLGRADRRVKVLGELVDLGAIEEAFEPRRAAVVALPDVRRGHRLVLVCEGREIDIDTYNRSVSGPWRLDRAIAVAEFPRNPLGKIRLGELQKRLESAGS